jgi:hypothetical protein
MDCFGARHTDRGREFNIVFVSRIFKRNRTVVPILNQVLLHLGNVKIGWKIGKPG